MKKRLFLGLILVALLGLAGCARLKKDDQNGLSVIQPSVVLGGDPPVQRVSYRLTLYNGGEQKVRVDWVKPVGDSVFKSMIGKQDLTLTVGKDLLPGESLEVAGKFQVKTNGIPKEELNKMGTLVKSFQVSSRQSFAAPELQTEEPGEAKANVEATAKLKATQADAN